jgi:hypothetical protein
MGFLDSIGSALGTNSNFHADPYKTNGQAYQWQGPDQAVLGNDLHGAQGQSAADYNQQQQSRAQQQGYLAMLQNAAAGNGPSQAQGILQQGANQAAANAMSMARSGGGNPAQQAAAMRHAQQVGASAMTNVGAQAAQQKAQEQQSAMGMMGGALQGQRSQDLQSMGMGNEMAGQYLGAQMGQANAQLGANMQQQAQNSANYNAAQGLNQQTAAQNAQSNSNMLGGLAGAAAGAAMMSDMRAKTGIAAASPMAGAVNNAVGGYQQNQADTRARQMAGQQQFLSGLQMLSDEDAKVHPSEGTKGHAADSFLASLHPYTYEYKDEGNAPSGPGRYLGVMAQDVERSPTGHTMVTDTPRGKAIEMPAMVSGLAAGAGRLHERISRLEEMAKSMRGKGA